MSSVTEIVASGMIGWASSSRFTSSARARTAMDSIAATGEASRRPSTSSAASSSPAKVSASVDMAASSCRSFRTDSRSDAANRNAIASMPRWKS